MKKGCALIAMITALLVVACACGDGGETGGIVDIEDVSPTQFSTPEAVVTPAPDASVTPEGSALPTDSAAPSETAGEAEPTATPAQQSSNVDPSNTIDPNSLDGTAEVKDDKKLSYSEYRSRNSDVVGWIKVGNTNVDYPVVKSHDNVDYLTQNALKEASKAGAIFMDYRCSTGDSHIIIYGHNMSKSKIMFAQLSNYSNRSFYDANRKFNVTFGDSEYTYKVFAVYSVDVNDAGYMAVDENIPNGAAFVDYMNNTLAPLSIFPVDTVIGEDDRVITLSTCTHTNYANGRFVIHAVRVS